MSLQHLLCKFDVKSVDGNADGEMRFKGYGAVFNNVDAYGDAIAPGAFKASLRESKKSGIWPSMLSQHGGWGITSQDLTPVGVWEELDEDDVGLMSAGILAPTTRGIELHTLMKMKPRPAIDGLSIGYYPKKWKINNEPKEGEPRRTLTEIRLVEISPVTFPANIKARVTEAKQMLTKRHVEQVLRDAGYPREFAKRLLAQGFPAEVRQRDAGSLDEIRDALRASSIFT